MMNEAGVDSRTARRGADPGRNDRHQRGDSRKLKSFSGRRRMSGLPKAFAACVSYSALQKTAGVPDGRIKIDLSIARGLDYYTGTI